MLSFSETEYDLGNVIFGQSKTHNITVTNNTPQAIIVNATNSSCSCTTGIMDKNPIEGYKTGIFKITFNSNKAGRGLLTKNITASWVVNGKKFTQVFRFKVTVT